MYAFDDLALDNSLTREAWVEEHDVNLQASIGETALDPGDEVAAKILEEQELNVRDLIAIAARNVEAVVSCRRTTIGRRWAGATPTVSIVVAAISLWGPRTTAGAVMRVLLVAIPTVTILTAMTTSRRAVTSRSVIIAVTTVVMVRVGPVLAILTS